MARSSKLIAHSEQAKLETALAIMQAATLLLVADVKGRERTAHDIASAVDGACDILRDALDVVKVES